jgi:prepilin-type processing-associated H-X9-DG protein
MDMDFSQYGHPGRCWGTGDSNTLYRLREGIERFLITDINNPAASALAQSEVPVMFDLVSAPGFGGGFPDPMPGVPSADFVARFNHVPGGMNCLYMDGHVEFIKYGTKFPASPGAAFFIGGASAQAGQGEDLWKAYAVAPNGPF